MAMLAPRHEAVTTLPRAYRTPLHLHHRLRAARRADPVPELAHQPGHHQPRRRRQHHCEAYLAHRRYLLDENGTRGRRTQPRDPPRRRPDRRRPGQLPGAVHRRPGSRGPAAMGRRRRLRHRRDALRPGQNKTPPVGDSVLQPHAGRRPLPGDTLGPHAIEPDQAGQGRRPAVVTCAREPPASPPAARRGDHAAAGRATSTRTSRCPCRPSTPSGTGSPPAGQPRTR